MKKFRVISLFLLIALLATVGSAAAAPNRNFRAHLSDAPGDEVYSQGQGQAVFQLSKDGQTMHFKLNVANIENVTMAHIHVAETAGGNGPPVVWLYPDGPPPELIEGRVNGRLAQGSFTAADFVRSLAGMEMDALLTAIAEGRAYVNVHTLQVPGGEIRGDIH
jgi:hypothetical protein